jgi:translation initiation factor IF-2
MSKRKSERKDEQRSDQDRSAQDNGSGAPSLVKPGSKPGSKPASGRPAPGSSQGGSKRGGRSSQRGRGSDQEQAAKPAQQRRPRAPASKQSASDKAGAAPQSEPQPRAEQTAPAAPAVIELPELLTVRELAKTLRINPIDVIKALMQNGIMANINQTIDYDTAAIISEELGFQVKPYEPEPEPEAREEDRPRTLRQQLAASQDEEKVQPRPPVVTVLGHVDHGKTTLLDAIRQANVVAGEAGGITQHIGAYQVEKDGNKITFLDTPGHEAFTAMRARGAQVTDLAVLVVAADDGVMPQTREAIDHARAADVPILVALNKVDKANANPDRVKQELTDVGLTVEEWGGDIVCVEVAAKLGQGIDELLENIILITEVADLKANPARRAVGTVIEGELDRQRGSVATLLVQAGTLHVGDALAIGSIHGRIRAMFDDKGRALDEALPSTPVQVLGLSDVPKAGDVFDVVEDERRARSLASEHAEQERLASAGPVPRRVLSLDDVFEEFQSGKVQELNLILKADVQGSLEPIANSLERLGTDELKVRILHQGTGRITESDVTLATASSAIVIGFTVEVDEAARRLAEQNGVDIRTYDIIYRLVEDVDKALRGLLEPVYREVTIGHAEVRQVFRIPRRGNIAGCYVTDGEVRRNGFARILRDSKMIDRGSINSLKRFKDDVTEVKAGFECGIGIEGFDDFEEGDILEFYVRERES